MMCSMMQWKNQGHPPNVEKDDDFFDPADVGDRAMFGRAVHLTIDKNNGVFFRTAEIDNFLANFEIEELVGMNEPDFPSPIYDEDGQCICNVNNFFGNQEMPEDPTTSTGLHRARPSKLNYEKLSP